MHSSPQSISDAKIQTFLAELANETQGYEQIRNLEGQVGREYRGRVVYELLQNAHDALPPPDGSADGRRVRFVLAPDALLVANDGLPVSDDNLRSLCNMALSSKDPAESIGNKGVGFRSTLDVSDAPEVYSRRPSGAPGDSFRGHSFRFSPPALAALRDAVEAFVAGEDPSSPYSDGPLVPAPDADRIRSALRRREAAERAAGRSWTAAAQTAHLSPYALPVALADVPPVVAALAAEGFATVVRLPLRDPSDADAVRKQIRDLADPTAILFLERLGALEVVDGENRVAIERRVTGSAPADGTALQVSMRGGETSDQAFWLWTHTLGGSGDSDGASRLRDAVAASRLSQAWDSVREAHLSVAVEASPDPRPGRYSVFLPTTASTGSGAFLNAPLSASLSRESIRADLPLNALLVASLAGLAAQTVRDLASADAADAVASAVRLALVAPSDAPAPKDLDASHLAREMLGPDLADLPLVATTQGWTPARAARIVAHVPGQILTPDLVRRTTPVPAVHAHLEDRFRALARVLRTRAVTSTAEDVLVAEAAVVAAREGNPDLDWNALVADLAVRFPNARDLEDARVLPSGADAALVAPSGSPTLFFPAQREQDALDVPSALLSHVAFLSPHVLLRGAGTSTTPARDYLKGIVQEYDATRLLQVVQQEAVPRTPLALGSAEADAWWPVLRWAVSLLTIDTSRIDPGAYPVPCRGGWFAARDATFGPGWDDGAGRDLSDYLRAAVQAGSETAAHAYDRLVVPPDHPDWHGDALSRADLERLGVAPGLRLFRAPYEREIHMSKTSLWFPAEVPRGISPAQWASLQNYLVQEEHQGGGFKGPQKYRFDQIWVLPGLDVAERLGAPTLRRLSRIFAASVEHWPDDGDPTVPSFRQSWRHVVVRKVAKDPHRFVTDSPLAILLQTLPWWAPDPDGPDAPEPDVPSSRWLLPQRWLVDRDQRRYAYLRPVPAGIATVPAAADALESLGAPRLLDEAPSPDAGLFLDAVADALSADGPRADDRTLAAHARDGWDHLDPDGGRWPRRLVCTDASDRLAAVDAREGGTEVFFPDGSEAVRDVLRQQGRPVVVIDPKTAETLAPSLPAPLAATVHLTSDLGAHVQVDGTPWDAAHTLHRPSLPTTWLAEVALAAHAHAGQSRRAETGSFRAAVVTLTRTRLLVAERLETVLTAQGSPVADPVSVGALWDAASSTLLVARRAPLHALVDPLQSLLKRSDLYPALRLVLDALEADGATAEAPPTDVEVADALATLRIDADQLARVRRNLRGDVSITQDRARAAVSLFNPSALSDVAGATSDEALQALLATVAPAGLSGRDLWELCRTVPDDGALGRALWASLGDSADLARWNAALAEIGRPPVESEDAAALADAHLRAARPTARAALRHALLDDGQIEDYDRLASEIFGVEAPAGLHLSHWEPTFSVAARPLADALERLGVSAALVSAIAQATDAADARRALTQAGADSVDPDVIRDQNGHLGAQAAADLALLAAALDHASGTPATVSPDRFVEGASRALRHAGVASRWTASDALRAVARHTEGDDALLTAAARVTSLDALHEALGVTAEHLDAARDAARDREDRVQRSARTVSVGRSSFDASSVGTRDDQQQKLWKSRLYAHLDAAFPTPPSASLTDVVVTVAPPESTSPKMRGQAGSGRTTRPPLQWKNDLVGATGEILVFRSLQSRYGVDIVPPSAWLSEERVALYGEPGTNGAGCDIAFDYKGRRYLVEVKSTTGANDSFEMGASEVDAARAAARPHSRQVFLIARVEHVFSNPTILMLPNPYAPNTAYRVEQRGAYVSFRRT